MWLNLLCINADMQQTETSPCFILPLFSCFLVPQINLHPYRSIKSFVFCANSKSTGFDISGNKNPTNLSEEKLFNPGENRTNEHLLLSYQIRLDFFRK